tara:strand:+ start:1663 stop:2577 length:915 start_codon:yes stop_codon:yes gene_type:complete
LKIYFDNVDFNSSTGPNTFGKRLALELVENFSVEIVGPNDNYDVFMCFIEPTHRPRSGSLFVQRLDGIWFKPEQYESHNKLIKWAYDNSDCVVWQSDFDKKMTQKWWGEKTGQVIHNGIKFKKAIPDPGFLKWRENYDKVFVCSASWHRQKRLKENIEFFQKNSSSNDALLVLGKNPDHIVKDSRIFYLGNQTHEACLSIYSQADWMIHLAWLDHCPNVVVEALSQGCSVICTDSGGTMEIVRGNGIVIPENNPYNFELTDYDNPYEIEIPILDLEKNNLKCDYLQIKKSAENYYNVFRNSRNV